MWNSKKGAYILYPSSFHTMWHVWIRAVQDDDHLSQGFFHSYVRTFFCSQLCLHFLLSHSVLDCPSYRYFLWFFCFHFVNSSHIFGSSWERLLGHVCHTTDKQADAAPNIYIYIYLIMCNLILHLYAHIWARVHTWVHTCKNTFTMPKPCDCVGKSVPAALTAATYLVVWW